MAGTQGISAAVSVTSLPQACAVPAFCRLTFNEITYPMAPLRRVLSFELSGTLRIWILRNLFCFVSAGVAC